MEKVTLSSYNLPVKITHNFPYKTEDSFQVKCEIITKELEKLVDYGFGGLVSNAPFGEVTVGGEDFESGKDYDSYLKNPEDFNILRHIMAECKRLGLRFWLYDEQGYPSGGAGGMTYDANPEFEARSMVYLDKDLKAGEEVTFTVPLGHKQFLSAFVYKSTGGVKGISDFTPVYSVECYKGKEAITLKNPTNENAVAVAFIEKHAFEYTHAEHNVFASRRYLDVGNREAVREFINNTYETYYREVGDKFNTINLGKDKPELGLVEAIFTDEPSYQGCNMHKIGKTDKKRHQPIKDAPRLPVVNWSRCFVDEFIALNGYSPLNKLIYCFAGDSGEARNFRLDFYKTTSYLIETNYFKQIGEWCAEHKLNFSGHVLLEDELLYHPTFEGNYFDLLRHMHYPGIDMLHSLSDWIYDRFMFTPKLISSVAIANGRKHVMDEVSMHTQTALKMEVTPKDMYSSVALQYVLGADVFTYYYNMDFMPKNEYRAYNTALGRIDKLCEGETVSDLLTYYPIETVQMHHKGAEDHAGVYSEEETECWKSVKELTIQFANNQVSYDYIDFNLLSKCKIVDGKIVTNNGRVYNGIVFPAMEYTEKLKALLEKFAKDGAKLFGVNKDLFDMPATVKDYSCEEQLVKDLDRTNFAVVDTACTGRTALLARDTASGRVYTIVNCDKEDKKLCLTITGIQNPKLYSPMLDKELPLTTIKTDKGVKVEFTILDRDTLIIK